MKIIKVNFKNLVIVFFAIIGFFFTACNKEDLDTESVTQTNFNSKYTEDTKLKTKFAKALANALADNELLREFIKNEALKKVNKDYDVVYQLVKDVDIRSSLVLRTSSSLTLRNLLLPYFETEQELIEIENKLPLLTIFVPDLLEGSFSASNWNTSTEIPKVAVRSYEIADVMIYGINGEEFLLEAQYMPDFPVVVVKDNERLLSSVLTTDFNEYDTRELTQTTENNRIRFLDDNFDPIYNPGSSSSATTTYPRVDPIHQQAYNAYSNYTPGGWQRDYIYYGLTPTNTEGGLNPTYREYLTSFKLTGNPQVVYNTISSAQDPNFIQFTTINRNHWTDGSFEFQVKLAYGAKNSNLGIDTSRYFGLNPDDIFSITTVRVGVFHKRASITGLKVVDFYNITDTKIEFPVWDLNNFSNQWKLTFLEVDTTITNTETVTATNKFNMNLSLEPSTGILKKIGLKFGASYEQSQTNTYVKQWSDVNDELGNSEINFYDNVVDMNSAGQLVPRKNYAGFVEFEIRPRLAY